MLSAADEPTFSTVTISGYWYRLIPSRFPTVDLYKRVAPGSVWPLAHDIESLTNPRMRLKEKATKGGEFKSELSTKFQNWNLAPFAYRNPSGTQFLNEHYGVLELSNDIQTALAVSIRKREAFLTATKMKPVDLEMRVLKHEVKGQFYDLSNNTINAPQSERWRIGEQLLKARGLGVRFQCPQRPAGQMVAVFKSDALGPSIQTEHYLFRWMVHVFYNSTTSKTKATALQLVRKLYFCLDH